MNFSKPKGAKIKKLKGIIPKIQDKIIDIGYEDVVNNKNDIDDYLRNKDYYEGFHWEEVGHEDEDRPDITSNYIKAFVDKFKHYEVGRGFNVKMKEEIEKIEGRNNPLGLINNVWDYNGKDMLLTFMSLQKSLAKEVVVQIGYMPDKIDGEKNKQIGDIFNEYDNGKIVLTAHAYDEVFYRLERRGGIDIIVEAVVIKTINEGASDEYVYSEWWTESIVRTYKDDKLQETYDNIYESVPFVRIINKVGIESGKGADDVKDIIPLNVELNLKNSNVSEIIDYYSSPITVIYGARSRDLEVGANRVWGGMPKDAKIDRLTLEGDLTSSISYVERTKQAMHEIGGIPEMALGRQLHISNTSAIAMETVLAPLLETVTDKRKPLTEGLIMINKYIIKLGEVHGIVSIPSGIKRRDYYHQDVTFPSVLPKDTLTILQEIQQRSRLGAITREDVLKMLNVPDIQEYIAKVDEDFLRYPHLFGAEEIIDEKGEFIPRQVSNEAPTTNKPVGLNKYGVVSKVNSGHFNNPKPKEQIE